MCLNTAHIELSKREKVLVHLLENKNLDYVCMIEYAKRCKTGEQGKILREAIL